MADTKQPLMTAIKVNGTWYGVEWRDEFDAIDSRYVPFGYI
jgi:hypothetical protein